MPQGLINETFLLLRLLPRSTIGGLIIGTSLCNEYIFVKKTMPGTRKENWLVGV